MDIRKVIIGLVLSLLLGNGVVVAGPDKTTSLLMDTPPSLFDLGMVRLNLRLDKINFLKELGTPKPNASYKWDDDKIWVNLLFQKYKGDNVSARTSCLSSLTLLRNNAGIDSETSKVYVFYDHSVWADLFNHIGYVQKRLNSELVNLDSKFLLGCTIHFVDPSKGVLKILSPLLSTSHSETIL
jgi:hypothetical protein